VGRVQTMTHEKVNLTHQNSGSIGWPSLRLWRTIPRPIWPRAWGDSGMTAHVGAEVVGDPSPPPSSMFDVGDQRLGRSWLARQYKQEIGRFIRYPRE
jgi:hypothetical protein